ncbi:Transcription initiation factor TFIID 23-30kDa subunit [Penicillium alfredii]|uniref:Transcription initiation factor TFIID 23-30kDa subunit n=1 Tax=Penicillium alfredii TaxID=1506179 RepID=A0A9W9ERE7_9EURO|nr:Transcription initiation factor TFIID 23-30kDa subunit [Penicillium alfredii]KAJ5086524.1 Transcription initiation factor TFIID 23-30kDa subunit [Penicillium alfredii]
MADSHPPHPPPQNGSQEHAAASSSAPDASIKPEPDLEASLDREVDMTSDNQPASDTVPDENGGGAAAAGPEAVADDPMAPAPAPSKKETSLREFLGKMDDYAPIKEADHTLTTDSRRRHSSLPHTGRSPPPGTGPNQTPPHLARLLALATQKFVSDLAADSYQYARIRASNSSSANNPMGSLTAAAGLSAPAGAGAAPGGVAGGEGGKSNKGNTHLGIQRPGFGGGGSGGSGQGRTVLTMEDLGMAVSEYGVTVKRGEFYR